MREDIDYCLTVSVLIMIWISIMILTLLIMASGCGSHPDDLEYEFADQGLLCSSSGGCDGYYGLPMHLDGQARPSTLEPFPTSAGVQLRLEPASNAQGIRHEAVCVIQFGAGEHTYHGDLVEFRLEKGVDSWTFYEGTCEGDSVRGALIMWTYMRGN